MGGAAAAVTGFLTGLSLIAAIGAQNAFVLRQGLRREHVGWVVAVCAVSDAVLIAAGVAGFGAVAARVPWLPAAALWAGVAFLVAYGLVRLRAAWRGGAGLSPDTGTRVPLGRALAACVLFTWANPHVYLDTLVLIGGLASTVAPHQAWYAGGAMAASAVFFAALGFGAQALAPLFASARAWRWLDAGVGVLMLALATSLALG